MPAHHNWFVFPQPNAQAEVRLFCLPHAGGGLPTFGGWASALPKTVELCVVQLPGRGNRFNERPFVQMTVLIEALAELLPAVMDRSAAFFGHSLGALICFEAARALRNQGNRRPEQLFVSACAAPTLLPMIPSIHTLPDQAFLTELKKMNGTPSGVLENDELLALFLPTLRADFALFDSYVYHGGRPLSCPITAFGGLDDQLVERESLLAWQSQTSDAFALRLFPGDHFYINASRQTLLAHIGERLEQQASGRLGDKDIHG